ncbi:MAG TPA: molybdate ABC transporter substrate-binding protein [Hyphomonadaceae bacterium]
MKTRRLALAGMAAAMIVSCRPTEVAAPPAAAPEAPVRVFAAASLTDVLKTIGESYVAAGHPAPVLNFAASSELSRQIGQGAEVDIFISADEAWMDYLAERKLIDPATRATLLTNTLVLIAPADKPITVEIRNGMDLKAALKGGKLAIANPDSVPAGKYAKEALEHFGAWAGVEAETARTENVRAALRFVEQGEAAAGIVYATDARAAGAAVTVVATFPPGSHTAVTYPAAIVPGKGARAGKGFLAFLGSPEATSIFESAGFGLQ